MAPGRNGPHIRTNVLQLVTQDLLSHCCLLHIFPHVLQNYLLPSYMDFGISIYLCDGFCSTPCRMCAV